MMKKRLPFPPILRKARRALWEAVREVQIEHKRLGLPLWVLKNGKVIAIPPNEIRPLGKFRDLDK